MKTSKLSIALVTVAIVMVVSSTFASPPPLPEVSAPEAGSTALLMSFAVAGLTAVKRFMR